MNGKRLIAIAVLVALAQVAFLGWMIAGRAAILRDGKEVLLKVKPVDPRDLLRGDYVVLSYEIANLPANLIANIPRQGMADSGGLLTVRLAQEADGYWRPVSAWLGKAPSPAGGQEADISGQILRGRVLESGAMLRVDYGIGRFYLPEGEGMAIQKDMRIRPFGIRAALGRDGTAQIKALVDGDKTLFEEPLY